MYECRLRQSRIRGVSCDSTKKESFMSQIIVSVGYEKRSPEDLVSVLRNLKVTKLIDVRELPISRRKGFSKSALIEVLSTAGIEYFHLRVAGNPFRKEKHDVALCLSKYRKHVTENPTVVSAMLEAAGNSTVAVLCFERDHSCCHRSVLLEEVERSGHKLKLVRA